MKEAISMSEIISLTEMARFTKLARQKGYAGGGEFEESATGVKCFRFGIAESFYYLDAFTNLTTSESFGGQETLRFQRLLIWYMTYSGLVLPAYVKYAEIILGFLKESLMEPLKKEPEDEVEGFRPRGPTISRTSCRFHGLKLVYRCILYETGFQFFRGFEVVEVNSQQAYICQFLGRTVDVKGKQFGP